MTRTWRLAVFTVGAVGVAATLVPALVQLTAVDEFADLIANYYLDAAVEERRSYNIVSSVIFDYRGFDTMFEQLILFAAVVGVALLLRVQREEVEERAHESRSARDAPPTSDAIQVAGAVIAGLSVLIAIYIILAVHITPGGGFQSGVLVAAGLLAVYLADEYALYDRLTPIDAIERVEAISAGSYLVVGLAGAAAAGTFLANFLPLEELGGLYASGTIYVLNIIVWFEVTAGFVLVFSEFLQQAVLVRRRAGS